MNIYYYILVFIYLCVGFLPSGFCGTIDPKKTDNEYIEFAQEDAFDCVAPLLSKKDNKVTSLSSCVIIKPHFAITAAHIFSTIGLDHTYYIQLNDELLLVEEVISHKGFKQEKLGYYDIAICRTSKEMIINKFPSLYNKRQELLKRVDICGYGIFGTFDTGATTSDGKKRAGTNVIESIKDHTLICSPSFSTKSNLEFLITHGDSGGGVFIDGVLVGINSYVYTKDGNANSSWNDKAGHTRISLFREWIDQNTK